MNPNLPILLTFELRRISLDQLNPVPDTENPES